MNQPLGAVTPQDFRQIREVFESALAYPAEDRKRFVESACSGNERLISKVHRILAADAESYPWLDGDGHSEELLSARETAAGHFDIVETLGRGGMGEVYRSRDTRKSPVSFRSLIYAEREHPAG